MEAEPRFEPRVHADSIPSAMFREEVQTCRIECWHGYVTSRFFVLTPEGLLLESRPFRCRHAGPPPDTRRARAALGDLVARLEIEGWTLLEEGGAWFATTFARTVLRPVRDAFQSDGVQVQAVSLPPTGPVQTIQVGATGVEPEKNSETKVDPEAESQVEVAVTEGKRGSEREQKPVARQDRKRPAHTSAQRTNDAGAGVSGFNPAG